VREGHDGRGDEFGGQWDHVPPPGQTMATIENRLRPVTSRDASVRGLSIVFGRRGHGGRR
jgi:hypothetical protein